MDGYLSQSEHVFMFSCVRQDMRVCMKEAAVRDQLSWSRKKAIEEIILGLFAKDG